jgi:hypothetical protein
MSRNCCTLYPGIRCTVYPGINVHYIPEYSIKDRQIYIVFRHIGFFNQL